MAIRYGMGRMTYANADASALAYRYWNLLPLRQQQLILHDALMLPDGIEREEWDWLLNNDAKGKP